MSQHVHVLHVDDDEAILDLTAAFLEKVDDSMTVSSETDPREVPTRLENEPIDCVVSDFDMPECDGLELCRRVRTVDAEVPFFLFTNRRGQEIVDRALDAGVTDYVPKETGVHHYTLLANRITLAVTRHRALDRLEDGGSVVDTSLSMGRPADVADSPTPVDVAATDGGFDGSSDD